MYREAAFKHTLVYVAGFFVFQILPGMWCYRKTIRRHRSDLPYTTQSRLGHTTSPFTQAIRHRLVPPPIRYMRMRSKLILIDVITMAMENETPSVD